MKTYGRWKKEILKRSAERRKRLVANRAAGFEEAEKWDLEFWQSQTPQQRLSALVAIRRDILMTRPDLLENMEEE